MNHIERLIQIVEDYYKLQPGQLIKKGKKQNVLIPRFVAIYILRTFKKDSLPKIALEFNRNHATIMNAVSQFEAMLDTNYLTCRKELQDIMNRYEYDACNVDMAGVTPDNQIEMFKRLAAL